MTSWICLLFLAALGDDGRQFHQQIGRISQKFCRQLYAQFTSFGAMSVGVKSFSSSENNFERIVQWFQFTKDSTVPIGNRDETRLSRNRSLRRYSNSSKFRSRTGWQAGHIVRISRTTSLHFWFSKKAGSIVAALFKTRILQTGVNSVNPFTRDRNFPWLLHSINWFLSMLHKLS